MYEERLSWEREVHKAWEAQRSVPGNQRRALASQLTSGEGKAPDGETHSSLGI